MEGGGFTLDDVLGSEDDGEPPSGAYPAEIGCTDLARWIARIRPSLDGPTCALLAQSYDGPDALCLDDIGEGPSEAWSPDTYTGHRDLVRLIAAFHPSLAQDCDLLAQGFNAAEIGWVRCPADPVRGASRVRQELFRARHNPALRNALKNEGYVVPTEGA